MDGLFKEFREEPPLYKNQPPVAGAIHWEKSLFSRIKHTIIRFMTLEEMMASDQGKSVRYRSGYVGVVISSPWCCGYDITIMSALLCHNGDVNMLFSI